MEGRLGKSGARRGGGMCECVGWLLVAGTHLWLLSDAAFGCPAVAAGDSCVK